MEKLTALIRRFTQSEARQKRLRRKAVERMHKRLHGVTAAQNTASHLDQKAQRLRLEALKLSGEPDQLAAADRKTARAKRIEKRAGDYRAKAAKEQGRADHHKSGIRTYTQRIHKIDTSIAAAEAAIGKLGSKVDLDKQTVTGGTFAERWQMSLNTSWHRYQEGIRAGRYSMEGIAVLLPFGPGPWSGRDDCSSFLRSHCKATGADDPSGHDFSPEGFTGDMAEAHGRWKQVSKAEMMAAGQGYIIYGSGTGHHTEGFCPTQSEPERTIGHGSPPCDPGTIHLFGSGEYERYYIFVD